MSDEVEFSAQDNAGISISTPNHVQSVFVDAVNAIGVASDIAKISFFQGAPPPRDGSYETSFANFQIVMTRQTFETLKQALESIPMPSEEDGND